MTVKAVRLDVRAITHLRNELKATNRLGRLIVSSVDLLKGTVFAILPEAYRADRLYAFRLSVFPPNQADRRTIPGGHVVAVPSTEAEVARWVQGILATDLSYALVCESFLLDPHSVGHPSLLSRRSTVCGSVVYHWATQGDDQNVANVVNAVYPVPLGFGVVSRLPVQPEKILGNPTIAPSDLSLVAQGTHCILLGAYDGESVLVWMHESAPFRLPLPVE